MNTWNFFRTTVENKSFAVKHADGTRFENADLAMKKWDFTVEAGPFNLSSGSTVISVTWAFWLPTCPWWRLSHEPIMSSWKTSKFQGWSRFWCGNSQQTMLYTPHRAVFFMGLCFMNSKGDLKLFHLFRNFILPGPHRATLDHYKLAIGSKDPDRFGIFVISVGCPLAN